MILVDSIVEYPADMTTAKGLPGKRWCHLISSDQETAAGEVELRGFGRKIGLSSSWIQMPGFPRRVHYDLTPSVRAKALAAGAIPVDLREFWSARQAGPEFVEAYLAAKRSGR